MPGQVVSFLTRHLGFPIPSPAVLERIGLRFRKSVAEFAAEGDIPVIRFTKGQRKLEVMRQARAAGIGFTEDPAGLRWICDMLGPGAIRVFCERWWARLPLPLTEADRAAGYWWDISLRQVEVSRTIVFDAPRHARGFFEALGTDNLEIGRPEEMGDHLRSSGPHRTPGWLPHSAAAHRG